MGLSEKSPEPAATTCDNSESAGCRGGEQRLLFPEERRSISTWESILDEIRRVVNVRGLKEVAFDLDLRASHLAHALAYRERKGIRAEWLPYLVAHAPDTRLAAALVAPARLGVVPVCELTVEQKLDKLLRALEKSGPVGAALLREAGLL
jgi:hypothetical protein